MLKRGLRSVFIFLIILSLATLIAAQAPPPPPPAFDATLSFEWLVDHSTNGNYGDITTTAIAAVALKDVGALGHANLAIQYIKSKEDSNANCFPQGNCNPQETAFALWALDEFAEQTAAGEGWLQSSLTAALKNNWWLQVVTTENGTCQISYPSNQGGTTEETIQVDAGTFPGCSAAPSNTFFDLNRCLKEQNVLVQNPSASFDVNCAGLGPSTIIAITYNQGTEYTLVEQAAAERYLVTINNGCFGESAKGSCSKEKSLYNNWLLTELEAVINTNAWLISNYDNLKAFDNALMYLASRTNEQMFLDDLLKLQRNDGSFNKDIRDTSIAILALKKGGAGQPLTDAIEFLKGKQEQDGSWESDVFKTAIALYSAFTTANVILAPPGGGPGPVGDFCGNGQCGPSETEATCPTDCREPEEVCNPDGRCDASFGEDSNNCPEDCTCGDGACDNIEKASGLCPEDCGSEIPSSEVCGNDIVEGSEECDGFDDFVCPGLCQADCFCGVEETGGGLGWLWILLVILVLGVGGFFAYNKFGPKGGKRKPTKRPDFRPFTSQLERQQPREAPRKMPYTPPRSTARASKVDDELDKSIKAAKKLLKKL